jgi:hypothetical protein
MGGLGSGERWSKKAVVEGRYSIDTASLRRWKLLAPGAAGRAGTFLWGRDADGKASSSVAYVLTVGRETGTLRLLYALKSAGADLDYPVRLVATPCHLGGVRWWFLCPLSKNGVPCGKRVRKLYLSGRYFGCRHCHDLTYRSSQESDSRVYALLRGGLERLTTLGDFSRMPVTQLCLAMKALTLEQKRLDRLDKRFDRELRAPPPDVDKS